MERFLQIQKIAPKSYPLKICEVIEKYCKDQNQKCLTVGCSVGRIVLEMSKYFSFYGTDYSARFFRYGNEVIREGVLEVQEHINFNIELGAKSRENQALSHESRKS